MVRNASKTLIMASLLQFLPFSSSLSGLGARSTAAQVAAQFQNDCDISNANVVVTGATGGIGLVTAKVLASKGARVFVLGRNMEKAEAAAREVGESAVPVAADMSDMAAVKAAAHDILRQAPTIDRLVLNAGIMALPNRELSKDGFEMQIATNHFSHYYLTRLLLDRIKETPNPRVVTIASTAHTFGKVVVDDLHYEKGRSYGAWDAYGQSKLANILFSKSLSTRLQDVNGISCSVHPGVIKTGLWKQGWGLNNILGFLVANKNIEQGAATTIYACMAPGLKSGSYLSDCAEAVPNSAARDYELAEALWAKTEEQLKGALGDGWDE